MLIQNNNSAITLLLEEEEDEEADFYQDEEDDDDEAMLFFQINKMKRRKLTVLLGFVEVIVPNFDTKQFRRHFRISPTTFEELLTTIGNKLQDHPQLNQGMLPHASSGRQPIPLANQLLITIWYLSSGTETLVSIGQRFGICEASCHRVRRRMLKFIAIVLVPIYIHFPTGPEIAGKIEGFRQIKGFCNIVGAVDGTHIRIRPPGAHRIPRYYYNRKGFHSIQTQLCVDSKLHIVDVYCGWPGSTHDAKVYKASPLCHLIKNLPDNVIVIGDAAYPCSKHLVTPFKGALTDEQKIFNTAFSATRMPVERANGLLKGRFRRLMHYLDMWELEDIVQCILGACVLHEVALGTDPVHHLEEYERDGGFSNREDDDADIADDDNGVRDRHEGNRRRDELMGEHR